MPDRPLTVLVLGVGGNVSQGICKALARSSLEHRLVAACIEPEAVGLVAADRALVSPLAADPEFPSWVAGVCRDEGVDAVLSGVEPVLAVLAREADGLRGATGAVVVTSPPEVLEIGQDKLATCRWLDEHDLPHPAFADAADGAAVADLRDRCGLGLVAKPRRGKAAAGFAILSSDGELAAVTGREGWIVQEHLGEPGEEFTAACFCDREGTVQGTIAMRRTLQAGTTLRAEIGDFPEVTATVEAIARQLRPVGPLNVQLRLRDGEPVPFELNVRFSGTTPVRAHFGFNEVEAALRHLVLGEPPAPLPRVTRGVALRYWNEVYLDGDEATFEDWGMRG